MTDTTTKPKRIQRQRTKGWRMPPNTVYVGRPSIWGNEFSDPAIDWGPLGFTPTAAQLVTMYENWLNADVFETIAGADSETSIRRRTAILESMKSLRGKDLACWCPLNVPCHADVLLGLANA